MEVPVVSTRRGGNPRADRGRPDRRPRSRAGSAGAGRGHRAAHARSHGARGDGRAAAAPASSSASTGATTSSNWSRSSPPPPTRDAWSPMLSTTRPRAEQPSEAAPADTPPVTRPRVSVIIPVRNERTALGPCLEAILAQTYPTDSIEIIVVDADSADGTREIAEDHARRDPRLRVLRNPVGSIPAGLNVGIRAARGEVIARVDARTRLAPDYLKDGRGPARHDGRRRRGGAGAQRDPDRRRPGPGPGLVVAARPGRSLGAVWRRRGGLDGHRLPGGHAPPRVRCHRLL